MEFPSGAVPLNSHFYIERPAVEASAYAELERPGSLIRIRAPKGMGKRSLLLRLLDHANTCDYSQVNIDFQAVCTRESRSTAWVFKKIFSLFRSLLIECSVKNID